MGQNLQKKLKNTLYSYQKPLYDFLVSVPGSASISPTL